MDAVANRSLTTIRPSPLLRLALLGDALASGATGLLTLLGGAALAPLFGLPAALLQGVGLFILAYAAVIAVLSRRESLPVWSVWTVIVLNLVWAADSFLLLVSGWVAPTGLGVAFVMAQALAVAGFAIAQWVGLKRSIG